MRPAVPVSDVALPLDMTRKLSDLSRRIRGLAVVRGIGVTGLVGSALLAVALLADFLFDLGGPVRAALAGTALVGVAVAALVTIVRPLTRRHDWTELAAVVESSHPEIHERLTSAIELSDPDVPESHKGSALMRELLVRQTGRAVQGLDVRGAVSSRRPWKWSLIGAASLLLLLSPFVVPGGGYRLLWSRMLHPWGNFDRVSNLYFEVADGDRVVARGSDVSLKAEPRWRTGAGELPESVWLEWTDASGEHDSRRMDFDKDANAWTTTVPHVFHPFTFEVTAERSRSRRYDVNVVEAPALSSVRAEVQPPAYTGLPASVHDAVVGTFAVFEGSRITFRMQFNKPVQQAEFSQIVDAGSGDPALAAAAGDVPNGAKLTRESKTPIALAADRKSGTLDFVATTSGPFTFRLTDEFGLHNEGEPQRILAVTPDQPPELTLVGDDRPQRVRPSDVVRIQATATDDVGLGALELHYRVEVVGAENPETVVKVDSEKLGVKSLQHEFPLDLASLGLKEGSIVSYRLRTADERPVPGPQEVWTEPRRIVLDDKAAAVGDDALADAHKAIDEALRDLRADLAKEKENVAALQQEAAEQLVKNEPFDRNNEVAAAAQREVELAKRAENLANRLGEHPLFANLTKSVRDAARENLAEAADSARKAVDETGRPKVDRLGENVNELAAAEAKLDGVVEKFEELAALERDLLELNRLADQAARLADQIAAFDQERRNPPANETPERQAAREGAQQARQEEFQQEQRELAQNLENLLQRRPELLEAARQAELDLLADVSKRARELAEPQEQLAEALRREAEQAAEDAKPLAEKQEALAEKAKQLAEDVAAQGGRPQAEPLDPEALRKALEELKAGNLEEAKRRQEQAAEDLAALAEALKKNDVLPADPREAAAELAKREEAVAEAAEALAKNAPAENAPQEEREAFERESRKLAAEQAAVQVAAARLEAPQAQRPTQQAAVDQAADAAEQLAKADPAAAAENAREAAEELNKLAEQLPALADRRAEAAERVAELRKEQQELAREAEKLAPKAEGDAKPPAEFAEETAAAREELAKREAKLAEEIANVDAPGAAEERAAAQRQAAAAQEALENGKPMDVARAQAQAEQALAQLESELAGRPAAQETVEELARREEAIRDAAAQAAKDNDAEQLARQAEAQQEVAEAIERLDAPAARAEQRAAEAAAEQAAETLRNNPTAEQARAAAENASEALERLQRALEPQAGDPGERPAERPQLAERAEQLAREQEQLAAETAGRQPQPAQQPMPNEPGQPGENPMPQNAANNPAQAARQQAEVAREAAENALDVARSEGAESPAAQAAAEFAREATEAAQQAERGQLEQAAETARDAAAAGRRAAEQMEQAGDANPMLRREGEALAQRQQELAERLGEMAESPAARREAQQNGQRQIADATDELAEALGEIARQLGQQPLNEEQAGEQARQAGESASEARDAMRQSGERNRQADAGRAAEQARQAAEALNRAADQAEAAAERGAAGERPEPSAIPAEAAERVAEAAQRITEAQRELEQAANAPNGENAGAPMPGESGANEPMANEPGNPAGSPMPGSPMPGAPSQGSPMPGSQPNGSPMPGSPSSQRNAAGQRGQNGNGPQGQNPPNAQNQGMPGSPGSPPSGQPGSKPSASPMPGQGEGQQGTGQQGAGQQGRGQPSNSQPGNSQQNSGQPGQSGQTSQGQPAGSQPSQSGQAGQSGPPGGSTPASRSAENLRRAAQSLAQASRQLQPGQGEGQGQGQGQGQASQGRPGQPGRPSGQPSNGQPGQPGEASQAANGQPSGNSEGNASGGNSAGGASASPDLRQLETELKNLTGRNWGQLPGHLRTEIMQAAKRKPNSEYSRLIKSYFEEIARSRPDAKP